MDLALKSEDYTLKVEEVLGAKFMHCDIHGPWTKSKRQRIVSEGNQWFRSINEPVYATHYAEQGEKHIKFLSLFNFVRIGPAFDGDGKLTEVWVKLTI